MKRSNGVSDVGKEEREGAGKGARGRENLGPFLFIL